MLLFFILSTFRYFCVLSTGSVCRYAQTRWFDRCKHNHRSRKSYIAMRQRASSQIFNDRRKSFNKFKSENNFGGTGLLFRGQSSSAVGPELSGHPPSRVFLNHDDINKRAIQLFHSENPTSGQSKSSNTWFLLRIFHPYDRLCRLFDLATVIWVMLLVFFIPIEIGFDWFDAPDWQKTLYIILDFWFAVDIILNFRTGFINHGTVVMDPKKISRYASFSCIT